VNRVDPLREGSGECNALTGLEGWSFEKFRKIFAENF
jgi:hypothetical protein